MSLTDKALRNDISRMEFMNNEISRLSDENLSYQRKESSILTLLKQKKAEVEKELSYSSKPERIARLEGRLEIINELIDKLEGVEPLALPEYEREYHFDFETTNNLHDHSSNSPYTKRW